MARVGIEIEASGPLFDLSPERLAQTVREAIDEGAVELTVEGASMAYDRAPVVTGGFRQSIKVYNSKRDDMFAWAHANPYGRGVPGARGTWLERGQRNGVRLRRGNYMFRTAFRRINTVDKGDYFLAKIVGKLDGS